MPDRVPEESTAPPEPPVAAWCEHGHACTEIARLREALRACKYTAMDFAVGADQACLNVERIVNEALEPTDG